MGAFSLTESSHRSASQLYSQIHELKEDLYKSHLQISELKQENETLKEKLEEVTYQYVK